MKLFYFSGSTIPSTYANSVHVMKMCTAFAKADCDVSLFGKGRGGPDIFNRYDVPSNFKLILAPQIPIRGLGGAIRSLWTLLQAWQKGPADLIYGRDFWTLAAMAGKTTPIALELHEIPKPGRPADLVKRILSAPNFMGAIVISQGLKDDLLKFHPVTEERILIAHDGADICETPPSPLSLKALDGTDFQIGYGGSLYKGKGIELILEIAKQSPNTGFHIFGGPDAEQKKWLSQNPPANIHFYGHVDQKKLKSGLVACDALIAPYMPKIQINTGADISRWISPLKLFEYMALQKPILCSDLPVLREIVEHDRNALLAAPEDLDTWIENINLLRKNIEIRKNIVNHAYHDLKTQYCWDNRVKNILTFLKRLS